MGLRKIEDDMNKSTPEWLEVDNEGATVTLSRPAEMNGVKQNKLHLRLPTVADLRAAKKQHKDDDEAQEIFLFASLAQCGPGDIERLIVRDYTRVQTAYFRLNAEDGGPGNQAAGQAAGH